MSERTAMQRIKEDINVVFCDDTVSQNQTASRLDEIIAECEQLKEALDLDESDETEYEPELID